MVTGADPRCRVTAPLDMGPPPPRLTNRRTVVKGLRVSTVRYRDSLILLRVIR